MKFKASFIPYVIFQCGFRLSVALIEPDADTLSAVGRAAFTAIDSASTDFYSEADAPPSFVSTLTILEETFGLESGSTKLDGRSGKAASLDLKHPILPGDGVGNGLLWSVGGGHGAPESDGELSDLSVEAVKNWMLDHQAALQIDASELFPSRNLFESKTPSANVRTAVHGQGDTIQLSMYRSYKGIPVAGSRATATIKRGNLVNVGLEKWGDIPKDFNTQPRLGEEDAYKAIAIKTGLTLTDEITCKPELQIITTSKGEIRASSLRSNFGNGYTHTLVWKVCPKFVGQEIEKMEGLVDAISGEVLSFRDTVDYLQAMGDVFPFSNDGIDAKGSLQDGWPMPFMTVGSATADSGGNYDLVGSQTARLSGPYVEMRDLCGTGYTSPTTFGIAELTSADGIDWGGMTIASGTDCATPGFGTAANTHSSRSGFYELNRVIEIARSRLPGNSWLQSKLKSYMNINNSCNAYFDGDVNFYRKGGSCANTGELAGVFVHEWGHGMDYNDVSIGIAEPSGEGIADIYTALRLHDSCIGRGFFVSSVCSGNGNPCTTCTGVRDIDYMKRSNGSPSTFTWANANCGTSVHCLGYVYSEAVWSLYHRELNSFYGYDDNTALEIVTRLTYIAAGNVQTWYQGSPPFGGCGPNSGYLSFLAADDDNGNLDDGTPHMKAIFKAFNDQEIACNTHTVQDSGCNDKPTEAPIVTISDGNTKATLSWNAVPGTSWYQVFRTEGLEQCKQGKILVATLPSSVRTYTDENLANNREYSYIVIPKGSKDSCFGPSSECTSVTPVAGPGIVLSCDNEPLIIPIVPGETPSGETRSCQVSGNGGFAGTISIGCDASSLTDVSCAMSPTSVTVSSTPTSVLLSIVPSSTADGTGSITVTASSSSLVAYSSVPVKIMTAGGAQIAEYDSNYKAPRCLLYGSECTSEQLLDGRGSMSGGNEANAPNTVDNCQDGDAGVYHSDESIDKIVVRSGYIDGTGSGVAMKAGERATIIATVYAWSTGSSDSADFYYSTDDSPTWTYISTKKPTTGGINDLSVDYQLPEASIHRVRVNFRYTGSVSPCSGGSWDDHDDLVFSVADASTAAPVTSPPTQPPTKKPTNSPTKKPTMAPSKKPTNAPSKKPTGNPTSLPTKAPVTSKPTNSPTRKPTASPTKNPTISPTKAPVTSKPTTAPTKKPTVFPTPSPTDAPITSSPTDSPVTSSPTDAPITSAPISSAPVSAAPVSPAPITLAPSSTSPVASPSGGGAQEASFDSGFGAPRCDTTSSSCSTGTLVNGRDNINNGPEANEPNTIDGCADGQLGSYHSDESIDKIIVRSGDVDDPLDIDMTEGGKATIVATVWAWASGASDTADFWYSEDASNPSWQYIGSVTPPGGGAQELKISYDLPQGLTQAVRVQFRYGGNIGSCTSGSYNDRDDVVFAVAKGTSQPTSAPIQTAPPTKLAGGGPQQASYDSSLTIPRCNAYGTECDSLDLLDGRGTMRNGNEANRPNTLGSCIDGNSGSYHYDESIDKIVVRSGNEDGTGSGVNMVEGGQATIVATVYPWFSGSSDYADFYVAGDSSNPQWQFIGTKQPSGNGIQEIRMAYTIPQGLNQAVRVNFRYRGVQGSNGACSSGSYDDTDDLAYVVQANPTFTGLVSEVAAAEEPKDIAVDTMKRIEISASQRVRASKASKNAKRA